MINNKDKKSSIIEMKEKVKLSISQKMQNTFNSTNNKVSNPEIIGQKSQLLRVGQISARPS